MVLFSVSPAIGFQVIEFGAASVTFKLGLRRQLFPVKVFFPITLDRVR